MTEWKMEKSTKIVCIIVSVFLFGLAALYLTGAALLSSYELEYRFWVDSLGKFFCLIVIPLWLIGLGIWALWHHFRGNSAAEWLIKLFGIVAAVFFVGWCWLAVIIMVFSTKEEHYVGGGMLSVVVDSYPNPTSYSIYQRVGVFFRRKSSLTKENVLDYLAEKYQREFYPAETDDEVFFVDAEKNDVRVKVKYINGSIQDDYPQSLADHYLQEGWQALGLNWEYQFRKTNADRERFCLMLNGEEDCAAFAKDAYDLVQYALEQDSLLKQYYVCLFYSAAEYQEAYGQLDFGSYKSWEKLSPEDYDTDLAKVTQLIIWEYSAMRLRDLYKSQESDPENQGFQADESSSGVNTISSEPSPEPQKTDREIAEEVFPDQCKAAEAIWNTQLKDIGYDYEPDINTKGNLVIWLGKLPADNLQSTSAESNYYLTYDRESKNGNCYIFVLSEEPETSSLSGAYLREFYACEKGTLKVVAGNKTGWGQAGCAEYREITGE